MTVAPHSLDEFYASTELAENPGAIDKFAVVAGTVDFTALLGGECLVSQMIAGALTAIAFLTFGSVAR